MEQTNFDTAYSAILLKLKKSIDSSERTLKEYLSAFTEFQSVIFFKDTKKEIGSKKEFVSKYYACAVQLTDEFDSISSLASEIYELINIARVLESDNLSERALELFETAMEISKAYERFLSGSETIVSKKDSSVSCTELHNLAVSFYTSLSTVRAKLVI